MDSRLPSSENECDFKYFVDWIVSKTSLILMTLLCLHDSARLKLNVITALIPNFANKSTSFLCHLCVTISVTQNARLFLYFTWTVVSIGLRANQYYSLIIITHILLASLNQLKLLWLLALSGTQNIIQLLYFILIDWHNKSHRSTSKRIQTNVGSTPTTLCSYFATHR